MLFSVVYLCQYKCGPQYNPASPAIGWLTMRIIFLSLGFSLLCLIESRSVFETRDLRKSRPWGLQFESDKEEEKENAGDVLEFLADKRLSKFANELAMSRRVGEVPRLSVTNSLDVLRERLLRQIARNRTKKPDNGQSMLEGIGR